MFEFDIEEIKNELDGLAVRDKLDVLERLDEELEMASDEVSQLNNELIEEHEKMVIEALLGLISTLAKEQQWDNLISIVNYRIIINTEQIQAKLFMSWHGEDPWRIYVGSMSHNISPILSEKIFKLTEKIGLPYTVYDGGIDIIVEENKLHLTLLQIISSLCCENDNELQFDFQDGQYSLVEKSPSIEVPQVDERDPLFKDAARCFVIAKKARLAALQRLFDISYKRAGLIMNQLEAASIIGPAYRICEGSCIDNATPRKVLVDEATLEQILESLNLV